MSMQQGFALIELISANTVRALELTAGLTVLLACIISLMVAAYLLRSNSIRRQLVKNLQEQATTDELTGLVNRRKFMEAAQSELKRAARFHHPLSVALLDIDRFKDINDRYGHGAGDKALIAIAKILQENIRETDIAARLGGDEFILILPETKAQSTYEIMERCRLALAERTIDLDGSAVKLTISVGIASLRNNKETLEALVERADQALYQAKNSGRNRVLIEGAS
jgi:diguanylate cyclase (GGDEF)-like protein